MAKPPKTFVAASATLLLASAYFNKADAAPPQVACPVGHTCAPNPTPAPATPRPSQTDIPKDDPQDNGGSIGNNYHTVWEYNTSFSDLSAQVTDSDAGFNVNSSDPEAFLTDEIWRQDGTQDDFWQEMGYVNGQLSQNGSNVYYAGIFGAFVEGDQPYTEFGASTNPQPVYQGAYGSTVTLATEQGNPNEVDFNYNGTLVGKIAAAYPTSGIALIGMESNSSQPQFNSFSNEVDVVGPQIYVNGASAWSAWPANANALSSYDDAPNNSAICGWISSDARYTPDYPYTSCFYYGN